MIIVAGATGQLGSQIVEGLLERVSPDRVWVSVQDTDRAKDLAARGVQVRHGDFADTGALGSALVGASQVLVVSVDTLGEGGVA